MENLSQTKYFTAEGIDSATDPHSVFTDIRKITLKKDFTGPQISFNRPSGSSHYRRHQFRT